MASLSVAAPRCEYRENPLGIDVSRPRLSWQLRSNRRGARQAAYRIIAAASEGTLAEGSGLLWDSDRVESDQSVHVEYAGAALVSGQRVYWKATVWDDAGGQVESAATWWEMDLLERATWQGQWIGAPFVGWPHPDSLRYLLTVPMCSSASPILCSPA